MRKLERLRDDERGATAIIVALCLIGLIGMMVLVVDVGGLLWNRRAMVNASDAAALAAAKSCVLPATQDARTAEQAADEWALDNSSAAQASGITNILQSSGCDTSATGYVTVQYGANQQLFFAGIFGAGQGHVTTRATAIWGPAGSANPMPIVVYQDSFQNCRFSEIDPNKTCYVWEDNNTVNSSQSAFGFLDLRTDDPTKYGWDSNPGVGCTDPGGLVVDWINNYNDPNFDELPVNYPNPTYVCRSGGMQQSGWAALEQLKGQELLFPINRCDPVPPGNPYGQLLPNSTNEAPCSSTPGQYDIIGYFAAKLVEVYRPNQVNPTPQTCGPIFADFPGAAPVNLDTFGIANSCFTAAPNNIDPASVTVRRPSGPANQRGVRGPDSSTTSCVGTASQPLNSFDYCYNPATRNVYWNAAGPAAENVSYEVSFVWSNDGPCGQPPSTNNSGHCLILQPVEVRIGGNRPGQGFAGNVRAYKLCEPSIPGSCSPVTVPNP
jgi:Flp pilus assembly protein TadG